MRTIKEVAGRAWPSLRTVCRVIHGEVSAKPALRARIFAVYVGVELRSQ